MIENKEKALTIPPTKANVKGNYIGIKPDILCSDYTILKNRRESL